MTVDLNKVHQLKNIEVREGSQWIYIADYNIDHEGTHLPSAIRVDSEIGDMKQILDAGGKIVILTHKGRYSKKPIEHLDFVVPHLSAKLGVDVEYYDQPNATNDAMEYARGISPGSVLIMGNTRFNSGEETGDISLAAHFAQYGDHVAAGGFAKSHRFNSSNHGIMIMGVPAYLTRSQEKEMQLLNHYKKIAQEKPSAIVLGGMKAEKVLTAPMIAENFDYIIPAGILLNNILQCLGYDVGASRVVERGLSLDKPTQKLLEQYGHKILMPSEVAIAEFADGQAAGSGLLSIPQDIIQTQKANYKHIPKGWETIGTNLSDQAVACLDRIVEENGIIVLAGSPSLYSMFQQPTDTLVKKMTALGERALVLGGDTAVDTGLGKTAPKVGISSGGGASLEYLANGTTRAFEALKYNKIKFSE